MLIGLAQDYRSAMIAKTTSLEFQLFCTVAIWFIVYHRFSAPR